MKPRILLVDDEETNLKLYRLIIQHFNADIFEASNGHIALDLINKIQPQIVVLDIQIPGINGYQILESIRKNENLSTTKVIMVSGYCTDNDKQNSLEAGSNNFMSKPIEIQNFRNIVHSYL